VLLVRVLDDVQVTTLDEASVGAELLVEPWPAVAGLEGQQPLAGSRPCWRAPPALAHEALGSTPGVACSNTRTRAPAHAR
jgi:hypothetical protein